MKMSVATNQSPQFGKWRSLFWPIYAWELKKVIPFMMMFFFINFNYTILRDLKDAIVVTGKNSGAESIVFLKFWGVMPAAFLFMVFYSKLSNILSKPRLFYTMLSIFIAFFTLYICVLYPNRCLLHPTDFGDYLRGLLPKGFHGLIAMFVNWTFSLFYIFSELWGSVALSLLFWGFANDTTKPSEAKRFYNVLGIGANLAMLVSGPLIIYFSKVEKNLLPGIDPWAASLNVLMGLFLVAAFLIMGIYWWMNKNVLTDTRFYNPAEQAKAKKEKPKMALIESFKFLGRSKYMCLLAGLVCAYGLAMNLVEVTWKGQLKILFGDNTNAYSAYMGHFSILTGSVTLLMMIFVSGPAVRRLGWTKTALITPIVILVTGVAFFSFIIFRDSLATVIALLGTTPVLLAAWIGRAQNIMSKATKYALFDPTKEMVYIPLDQESKVKGKAAIDVVGARLGKSGGSLVNQGLIITFGSIAAITPYVAGLIFLVIFAWIGCAKALGKLYAVRVKEREMADVASDAKAKEGSSSNSTCC
jgi:ATP:ADP antiporter, AAA family